MRSNRPLTAFAVWKLEHFVQSEFFRPGHRGNTSVNVITEDNLQILRFSLHGSPIAELSFEKGNFVEADIFDGGFYDKAGRPSRTTRERLNGLLDAMGGLGLIPEGVRVFFDDERCFIGRESARQPFGEGFPPVAISNNVNQVEFLK